MSRTTCTSKQALLRGLRPNSASHQRIQCGVCPHRCIYCDIWKLATLIASHLSFSSSSSSSPTRSQRSPTSPRDSFDWERSERAIEAQFQTQRARLASIMSICTVEGADECEGLRLAHDRCLGSVEELIMQKQMLQQQCTCAAYRQQSQRRPSKGCGESRAYYHDERRPSMAGMAM